MKYRQLILVVILILTATATWSQEKFRPGFIITTQQDTIEGLLRYKSAKTAWISCTFKKDGETVAREYSPAEISAYGFKEGKFYTSKTVMQDGKENQVFLEFLIRGQASIYALADYTGTRYFAETKRDGMVELSEPERILHTDSGHFYAKSRHKGKLRYIMNSHPELLPAIEKTELGSKQLIRLAKEYHELACPEESCIVFERKFKPVKAEFTLNGGLSLRKLNFTNRLVTDFSPGYIAGFTVNLRHLFFSDERFSIETGISYSSNNKYTFKNSESNNESEMVTYNDKIYFINPFDDRYISDQYIRATKLDVETMLSVISVPLSLKYTFNSDKLRPSLGIGGVMSIVSSQNKDLEYHYFSEFIGSTFPPVVGGLLAQASVSYKTGKSGFIGLGFKYQYESNMGNVNEFLTINTLFVSLSYTF